MKRYFVIPALALFLSACSNTPIQPPSDSHLRAEKVGAGDTATIPAPVQQTLAVPKPRAAPKVETYSVVVNNVRVQELLFALARDAKLNVDIHPGIEGMVTLNAIDQTLQQLLTRIAKQVDIRWELDGPNLAVMPDSPFLRTYKVDYVNMSRDTTSTVTVSSQISAQERGQQRAATPAATIQSPKSRTRHTTDSGKRSKRTSRTSCTKPTRFCPAGSSETVVERQEEQATTGTGAPPATGGSQQRSNRSSGQPESGNSAAKRHDRHAPRHLPRSRLGHRKPGSRHHQCPRHRTPA